MKKQVIALIIVLLAGIASATTSTFTPLTIYETTTNTHSLAVNNTGAVDVITSVMLATSNLTITGATTYGGWITTNTTSTASWTSGTIETNVQDALFSAIFTAPLVTTDTNVTVTTTLTPIGSTDFTITILNDATPPTVQTITPQEYALANSNSLINTTIIDPETGVSSVSYAYNNCTGSNTTVPFTQNGTTYIGNANFSTYNDGQSACYTIIATNNAGETSQTNGTLTFDGVAPTITITSPTTYAGINTNFTFTATDNVATELSCDVDIGGTEIAEINATSGTLTTITANLSNLTEGSTNWTITCADGVGLTDTETTPITIDLTTPTITLTSNNPTQDTIIIVNATDNNAIDTLTANLPANTSTWPEGHNNYTITATDVAGNQITTTFDIIIDRSAPTIDLDSPIGGTVDYHINFTITTTDNLATTLTCTVNANNNSLTQTTTPGTTNFLITTELGTINWYATCSDEAGNSVTTTNETTTAVDLTGPDIEGEIEYALHEEENEITITVTDISGVDTISGEFDGQTLTFTQNGDEYTTTITPATIGNTSITITANDTNGFTSIKTIEFPVIENYIITATLTPNPAQEGQTITITGDITGSQGTIAQGTVNIQTPIENITTTLNTTYETSFTAPSTSTTVTIRYETGEYAYLFNVPLTIGNGETGGSGGDSFSSSTGIERTGGGSSSTDEETTEETQEETPEEITEETPEQEEYQPLDPEDARSAFTPEATGIFGLGKTASWIAVISTITLLAALGYSGWQRRPKKENDGIDWNAYFNRK